MARVQQLTIQLGELRVASRDSSPAPATCARCEDTTCVGDQACDGGGAAADDKVRALTERVQAIAADSESAAANAVAKLQEQHVEELARVRRLADNRLEELRGRVLATGVAVVAIALGSWVWLN